MISPFGIDHGGFSKAIKRYKAAAKYGGKMGSKNNIRPESTRILNGMENNDKAWSGRRTSDQAMNMTYYHEKLRRQDGEHFTQVVLPKPRNQGDQQ